MMEKHSTEIICRVYATANIRSPFVWIFTTKHSPPPPRSGITKSAMAGVRLGVRYATHEEAEEVAESARMLSWSWPSVLSLVRFHREQFGRRGQQWIIDALRSERHTLRQLQRKIAAKVRARDRKKARAGR